jgi:hypothetical protein
MVKKVKQSEDLPYLLRPKIDDRDNNDPAVLEKAMEEGRIVGNISLEVVRAINRVFRDEVQCTGEPDYEFLIRNASRKIMNLNEFLSGEKDQKAKLTGYRVEFSQGMSLQAERKSIEVFTWEELPVLADIHRDGRELKPFNRGIHMMLAIRDRLEECGYNCSDQTINDQNGVLFSGWFTKAVNLATPKIAVFEMTGVIEALGIKKEESKR